MLIESNLIKRKYGSIKKDVPGARGMTKRNKMIILKIGFCKKHSL
jgi:hypothetical protein